MKKSLFENIQGGTAELKHGYAKILGTCAQAARGEYDWV